MAMQSIELNFDPTAYDTAQSELFTQLGKLQEARNEYDALKTRSVSSGRVRKQRVLEKLSSRTSSW